MLSPNTLLNKARYRVDSLHLGRPAWNVYSAVDQTSGAMVLVVEYGVAPPSFPEHEGLLKIADSFLMNGRKYDVTEPVRLQETTRSLANAWDQFSIVLMALNTLSAVTNTRCEICPKTVVATSQGVYKLLPLEAAFANVDIEAWHVPLERIWRELDHISQRAIYAAWDEASISDLERPLDEASALYSVAALFYKALTGVTPPSAFERTVDSLDAKDPLIAPNALIAGIGEAGDHLLRCLELRRKDRFRSFEEAIMSLPALSLPRATEPADEESNVLDLGVSPVEGAVRFTQSVIPKAEAAQVIDIDVETEEVEAFLFREGVNEETPAAPVLDNSESPIFTLEAPTKSRMGMKFVAAGVVAAAIGGIGWGAYQYSATNAATTTTASSSQIAVPAVRNDPVAAPTPMPEASPAAANTAIEIPPVTVQTALQTKADAPKQRPQIAETSAPKAASKTDKPKKKVTVDDLINDN